MGELITERNFVSHFSASHGHQHASKALDKFSNPQQVNKENSAPNATATNGAKANSKGLTYRGSQNSSSIQSLNPTSVKSHPSQTSSINNGHTLHHHSNTHTSNPMELDSIPQDNIFDSAQQPPKPSQLVQNQKTTETAIQSNSHPTTSSQIQGSTDVETKSELIFQDLLSKELDRWPKFFTSYIQSRPYGVDVLYRVLNLTLEHGTQWHNEKLYYDLWALWAQKQPTIKDQLEAYKNIENHGIGIYFSSLYCSIAQLKLGENDLLGCQKILDRGIQRGAKPMEELQAMYSKILVSGTGYSAISVSKNPDVENSKTPIAIPSTPQQNIVIQQHSIMDISSDSSKPSNISTVNTPLHTNQTSTPSPHFDHSITSSSIGIPNNHNTSNLNQSSTISATSNTNTLAATSAASKRKTSNSMGSRLGGSLARGGAKRAPRESPSSVNSATEGNAQMVGVSTLGCIHEDSAMSIDPPAVNPTPAPVSNLHPQSSISSSTPMTPNVHISNHPISNNTQQNASIFAASPAQPLAAPPSISSGISSSLSPLIINIPAAVLQQQQAAAANTAPKTPQISNAPPASSLSSNTTPSIQNHQTSNNHMNFNNYPQTASQAPPQSGLGISSSQSSSVLPPTIVIPQSSSPPVSSNIRQIQQTQSNTVQQQASQLPLASQSSSSTSAAANLSSSSSSTSNNTLGAPKQLSQAQLALLQASESATQAATALGTRVFFVKQIPYIDLGRVGKGGSGSVYKVLATNGTIWALKVVEWKGQPEVVTQYKEEIRLLESVQGNPHIIKLLDYEIVTDKGLLYLVFEFAELDLKSFFSVPKVTPTIPENPKIHPLGRFGQDVDGLRYYWKAMLNAVQVLHNARVVHRDLKPANFVIVKGCVKIIDFGLARQVQSHTIHAQVAEIEGTLLYMAPEVAMGQSFDSPSGSGYKVSFSVDIWSLGVILYQLVFGFTPFEHVKSGLAAKLAAIATMPIPFPNIDQEELLDCMKHCLQRDPKARPTIAQLLEHPFLGGSIQLVQ